MAEITSQFRRVIPAAEGMAELHRSTMSPVTSPTGGEHYREAFPQILDEVLGGLR